MKVNINVAETGNVSAQLRELGVNASRDLVTAINRVQRDLKSRIVRKTTEIYNIRPRELAPYVTLQLASASNVHGTVRLLVRAIPIEAFRPRVRMQDFTFTFRGRTITRKLPAVFLQRFRGGEEKYVGPAFPLTQRRSGLLRSGEKIRRRVGDERDRLTKIRYYTFPKNFIEEELLPDAQAYIGPAVSLELDRAFRRRDKAGVRVLRHNA